METLGSYLATESVVTNKIYLGKQGRCKCLAGVYIMTHSDKNAQLECHVKAQLLKLYNQTIDIHAIVSSPVQPANLFVY